ncbi:carbon-nitrogen hydrolase family protein [Hydrogenophaga aquatica]
MNNALTVALWQTHYTDESVNADDAVPHMLERLDAAAAQASAVGAHLLITPEMALTGYHRDPEWLRAVAQPADGPWARAVGAIARRHGLALVYGYPEAAPAGQRPYNAAQAVGPDGAPMATYRKTHLFGAVDEARFTPGPQPPATFVYRGWSLGLLICYDVEFPEAVRLLALQGADAVLVPTANMPAFDEVQQLLVPARACENHLYVAYANACGQEAGLAYGGLSTVAGPHGQVLSLAGRDAALSVVTLMPLPPERQGQLAGRRPELYGALAG